MCIITKQAKTSSNIDRHQNLNLKLKGITKWQHLAKSEQDSQKQQVSKAAINNKVIQQFTRIGIFPKEVPQHSVSSPTAIQKILSFGKNEQ